MEYLLIENPGTADPMAFTILGASTSADSENQAVIGQFGSGNKHAVGVCLRHKCPPVIYCGRLGLEFYTEPMTYRDNLGVQNFDRICVKYKGKDDWGKSRTNREKLSYVLDYGKKDWISIDLALREYVSNAIDHAIKMEKSWERVRVEIVDERQVKACPGVTRVYVPVDDEVKNFYLNLDKWFLHFSEPEYLNRIILPKAGRNLIETRRVAVIYRRGVRVREIENDDTPSLFDYNLNSLPIDEARKVDDYSIKYYCGQALSCASPESLKELLSSAISGTKVYWEHGIYGSWLVNEYDRPDTRQKKRENWQKAAAALLGSEGALCPNTAGTASLVEKKGYTPKIVKSEGLLQAAQTYGIRTEKDVLNTDEREGRTILPATPAVKESLDLVWKILEELHLTLAKSKPTLKCYSEVMDAGRTRLGFYRENCVWINSTIADTMNVTLIKVMVEEVCHFLSGALDEARDLQDFAFRIVAELIMRK